MALPALTFARIVEARTVSDRVLYDIAVQTASGEVRLGSIEAGGLVFADGLIVGMLTGSADSGQTFRPMRQGGSSTFVRARITGAVQTFFGQWDYTWVEVEPASSPGQYGEKTGGRNSSADGVARNSMETGNGAGSTLGSGVDTGNLPPGFEPVPIGTNAIVRLSGPFGDASPWWEFEASPHVDGTCGGVA